jgi:hypothetical protein
MHTSSHRRIGIQGIDHAPWGEHICVFFNSKSELVSLTVPFIAAGLRDNECCIWVTGDPLRENEAFEELVKVLPDANHYLARRQLEIVSSTQWYLPSGRFDLQIIVDNWMRRAQRAQAEGLAGIRITGNPVWLQTEEDWDQFARYEEIVHQWIKKEKVLALCTYPVWVWRGQNIIKTLSSHSSALLSDNQQWRRLQLSSR